jgi:hypothetical protein
MCSLWWDCFDAVGLGNVWCRGCLPPACLFHLHRAGAPRSAFVGWAGTCISRSTAQPSSPLLAQLLAHSRPRRSIPGGFHSQGLGKIRLLLRTFPPFRLHSPADSSRFRSILIGLALSDLGYNVVCVCSSATGAFAARRSVHAGAVFGESVPKVTVRVQEAYVVAAGSRRWRRLPARRSKQRNSHFPTQSRVHTQHLNRQRMLSSRFQIQSMIELID